MMNKFPWFRFILYQLRVRRALIIITEIEKLDIDLIRNHLRLLNQSDDIDLIVDKYFMRFVIKNKIAIQTLEMELYDKRRLHA